MTVTVKGVPQLIVALERLQKQAQADGRKGIHEALDEVRREWARRVPYHDGHYRRAMEQPKAVKTKLTDKGAVGYVNVPYIAGIPGRNKARQQPLLYAHRLEYGDSEIPAQPSARPALDAVRPRIGGIVGKNVALGVRSRR